MDKEQKPQIENVPVEALHREDGVEDLLRTPNMRPYIRFAELVIAKRDLKPGINEIASLPLTDRCLWRVVSALKWALCDVDDLSVRIDRETLPKHELERVIELLKLRPMQFCIFLAALVGKDEMERQMAYAIRVAKQATTN